MKRNYIKSLLNRFYLLFEIIRERYACLFMHEPKVMSREETIDFIVKNKCSVSRNGDGEIYLMRGERIDFQEYNPRLSELMKLALTEQNDRYLPCVIDVFRKDYKPTTYYKNHLRHYRYYWYKFANPKVLYGDTNVTRFYSNKSNAVKANQIVKSLRRIWENSDLLIVEGEMSRLGVGNDLFDNARNIRRILAPSLNAFSRYDEIKQVIERNSSNETLVLLALGPTATALAYELYKDGYWAIDIGHIDICYEWYIRGLERGDNIPGKYTNESVGEKLTGDIPQEAFQIYEKQIIERIL